MADGRILNIMTQYNNRTVSVIIPVYNAARFIGATLESVLNQSYKDIEVVLVDDCSADDSAKIIAEYSNRHPSIIYHRLKKNEGAAVARNTALHLAGGRYVAFLDSDDLWCSDKIEKQLAFMDEKDAAMSCTAMDTMDENGNHLGAVRRVKDIIEYDFLLHNTMIATSTVIIDRNKTGNFTMPLRRGGQDYATWLMLMRNGSVFYGLDEVLTHYRILAGSLSSNKYKSVRQVWQIQTQDENIPRLSAAINVCFFIANAFAKHFLK